MFLVTLALLCVVRNAEKDIEGLLSHVNSLVDEYVVIDDCSDDDTAIIAQEYLKEKASDKKCLFWRSNEPHYHCAFYLESAKCAVKSDYILRLDADERLIKGTGDIIRNILNGEYVTPFMKLHRYNYLDGVPWEGLEQDDVLRLFEKAAIYYPDRIHTQEQPINGEIPVFTLPVGGIYHNKSNNKNKQDIARYIQITKDAIANGDDRYLEIKERYVSEGKWEETPE
jgi:glycosyltransferase involved in cell wall biosynthesis